MSRSLDSVQKADVACPCMCWSTAAGLWVMHVQSSPNLSKSPIVDQGMPRISCPFMCWTM